MNHILAALFAIGILFGLYQGTRETADGAAVRADLQALSAQTAQLPPATDAAAVAAQLDEIEPIVARLTDEDLRLPSVPKQRLTAVGTRIAAVRSALPAEGASPETAALAAALEELRAAAELVPNASSLSDSDLTIASVSRQGNLIFTALAERAISSVIELAFPLIGLMAFWLGIMRVAEKAGLVQAIAGALRPVFRLLFPKVPKDHPANGAILMSLSANILGLDNAATPLSLKAMKELQTLNTEPETMTNDQGMLLTLNATSITVIPFSIIALRVAQDSHMANDILVPVIIADTASTVVGVAAWLVVRRFTPDPAAIGAEAARITAEQNAKLHGEVVK